MGQQKDLEFAVDVAKEAGKVLMSYFGKELTKSIKRNPNDYATEADIASEKLIIEQLAKFFPNDAVVAEESGAHGNQGADYTWIVDPLDGTHHFASGKKNFGVMICRARGETLDFAVVWNPAEKVLATAVRGGGTYLNGNRIEFAEKDLSAKPLSVERDNQEQLKEIGYGVTNLGASANTLITLSGERRAFVSSNGFMWDFAPPSLMLAEAGWNVTDFRGNPFRWDGKVEYGHPGVIAAEPELHSQLVKALSK